LGLTLLTLYGPRSPLGVDLAYARAGVVLALLFVTLPFVVRAVQPVLLEIDREMEEAAAISILLLAISLVVMLSISAIERWGAKHAG